MYLFCTLTVRQFEGESTLLTGDLIELYVPAIRSMANSILSGEGLGYSWSLSLGMNATEYYTSVAGCSIGNLWYFFFPHMDAETFVVLNLLLKAGLAGAAFAHFGKRVLKADENTVVFFSIFYALCGFQTGVNIVNLIWMDMAYLLPFLSVCLVDFMENRRWKRLVLVYAYSFLNIFYMAYILGIFSAVFLVLYLLTGKQKKKLGCLVTYGGCVLLAVGMTAFALLPTAVFLLTGYAPDATVASQDSISTNLLLLIGRFLMGIADNPEVRYPYLYSGIPVLLLLPFFFTDRRIAVRERLLYGSLLLMMLLSCLILPLYLFWHGFDAPDLWYFRFAYIISFLCVAMACREAGLLTERRRKELLIGGIAEILIGAAIALYAVRGFEKPVSLWFFNIGLFLGWMLFAGIFCRMKAKNRKKWLLIGMAFAMAETVWNGCLEDRFYTPRAEMEVWETESRAATALLKQDTDFYRVQYENDYLMNSDTYWDYKGISDFGTFENYEVRRAVNRLGGYTSARVMTGYGLNPLTQLILGVKYRIHGSGSADYENMGAEVTAYPRFLGLGFLVSQDLTGCSLGDENVFENGNELASCMNGEDIVLFRQIPEADILVAENGIRVGDDGENRFLEGDPEAEGTVWMTYQTPDTGNEAFVVFQGNNVGIRTNRPQIKDLESARDIGYFGVRYTKRMNPVEHMRVCLIAMKKGVTENRADFREAQFYEADEEALDRFYRKLKEGQMEISEYGNGFVHGRIAVSSEDQMLFTSIPYDKGWHVTAASKAVEPVPVLDGAFLGVHFPGAGEYELTFMYEAPGQKTGMRISVLSWVVFAFLMVWNRKRRFFDDEEREKIS